MFKDGAHDRVFNSILNGTVSVTDTSKYLCGELKEGQGVCYYDLAHMEKLPELVRDLLADDARREEIVRAGIPVVEEKHTWIRRAHQLLEWIEDNEGIMSEEIGSDESYDRKAVSESRWQV